MKDNYWNKPNPDDRFKKASLVKFIVIKVKTEDYEDIASIWDQYAANSEYNLVIKDTDLRTNEGNVWFTVLFYENER